MKMQPLFDFGRRLYFLGGGVGPNFDAWALQKQSSERCCFVNNGPAGASFLTCQECYILDKSLEPEIGPHGSSEKIIYTTNLQLDQKSHLQNNFCKSIVPWFWLWTSVASTNEFWSNVLAIIWQRLVVSNILDFHPYLGKMSNSTSIFFRWVAETTNQMAKTVVPSGKLT